MHHTLRPRNMEAKPANNHIDRFSSRFGLWFKISSARVKVTARVGWLDGGREVATAAIFGVR